jgi:arabinogalactan oligomer/maltooligosaccharide transport system permease protein
MSTRLAHLASHAVLIVASAFALYPVLWVVKLALSSSQVLGVSASPIPDEVSFAHFATLLNEGHTFGRQFFNSVVVAGSTSVVAIGISCSAAYGFSRFRFPGREAGLGALLLTQIFPGIVMMIPLYILLDSLGLLNSLLGLSIVYSTTAIPFCIWMLKGYFDSLPKDIEEAAMIDGASRWYIFVHLVLPLARPAIAVTALFSFMTAWNEFILAATLINEQALFTLPVALQRYVGEYQTDWGTFAAGAVVTSFPVMLLFYALQKHLVGGLTGGAVKG